MKVANKKYLFFFVVVLLAIVFSFILKNGLKTPVEDLSIVDNVQKNSSEAINQPAIMIEKIRINNKIEEISAEQNIEPFQVIEEKHQQLVSDPPMPQLTKEEQLEIEFSRAHWRSRTPKSKHKKFTIDSVFEREQDENWSSDAEIRLSELMTALAVEYDFEKDLGDAYCSDVMCFIGLEKYHKLPHMVYNSAIMGDGGFGTFRYYHGGKSKKGLYVWRFKFNSMGPK